MRFPLLSILLLVCAFFCPRSAAHQIDSVELEFLQTEGQWKLEGLLDIAYMMPESRGVQGAPPLFRDDIMATTAAEQKQIVETAEQTLRKLLELQFAGKTLPWTIRFPNFEETPLTLPPEMGGWALMKAIISTPVQHGAGELTAHWHDDLDSELIIIIEEGEDVGLLSIPSGTSETLLSKQTTNPETPQNHAHTPGKGTQSISWLVSGYRHVIPLGLDHLLFIIGLFLLVPKWKPLLIQSLLFTVAHSITLALAIFEIVSLPSLLVEILIAASIAYIGIENLLMKQLRPSRLIVIFTFGLLHGLGFAGVLGEKLENISGANLAIPLINFNIGVELAQITVLICAFILILPFRKWTKQIRIGGSVLITLAGLFWMIERITS